jgi:WD40 repeat protein
MNLFIYNPYAVGNILHLLCQIKADLTGLDLSDLQIWQADLSAVTLHQANLSQAQIAKSLFAESFGSVISIAFSPDGQWLAAGEANSLIHIWEIASCRKTMTLQKHSGWVWSVIFIPHPDDPRRLILVSASDDPQIKFWDLQTGNCLRTLVGHTHSVNSLALSPNGHYLASSSQDSTIRLWDLQQLDQPPMVLQGHSYRIWSVVFSPDGQTLASGAEDRTIKLWDVTTGTCHQTVSAHTDWVRSLAFSPDGRYLASGSNDRTIRIWQIDSSERVESERVKLTEPCLKSLPGHSEVIKSLRYSPDGQILASGSHDQTAKLWNVATGQCLKTLQGHTHLIWSVMFHPDGTLIVTGSNDQTIRLWNVQTGQCIKTLQGHTNSVFALATGVEHPTERSSAERLLISGHEDNTIKVWNAQTGQILKILQGHSDRVFSVSFAPAITATISQSSEQLMFKAPSDILISSSADRTVRVWNWRTGQCLKILKGHMSWVWSAVSSPCGHYLVSTSYDRTTKFWDLQSGTYTNLQSEYSDVALAFSSDSKTLASSGFNEHINLWNPKTKRLIRRLEGHTNKVWKVAFNADGTQLASASYDQTVRLWDVTSGQCLQIFEGHTAPVLTVTFSPNGWLISSGFDQTLRVWNIHTGECLRVIKGHTGHVYALGLVERSTVYSGSFDETIKLWDINTGKCIKTLQSPRPYEQMKITDIGGLTAAELANLRSLGAVD